MQLKASTLEFCTFISVFFQMILYDPKSCHVEIIHDEHIKRERESKKDLILTKYIDQLQQAKQFGIG